MDTASFIHIALSNHTNRAILDRLSETGLVDAWLVAGSLFQTVWNWKTGRPADYGIRDYDVFFFDDSDLSWEAEDRAIKRAERRLAGLRAPIEIRNQARAHLWYEDKFGLPYTQLHKTTDGIDRFLATTCMFGLRQTADGAIDVYAPFGFNDLENLLVRPSEITPFDSASYVAKAARWKTSWPELQVARPDETPQRSTALDQRLSFIRRCF